MSDEEHEGYVYGSLKSWFPEDFIQMTSGINEDLLGPAEDDNIEISSTVYFS